MKRILIFLCTIASTAGYISCSDSAIGDEYGSTLIYMPQATHNLGTDNNLTLKLSKEAVTATPSKRTQTTLGIYRAGTAPKESATVDLLIDKDSLTSAQQYAQSGNAGSKYDIYETGVLLDKKYYDKLPETLTIPNGSREATTQLVLHNAEIFADYPVGQILLLPVRIANPTRYTLNHSLSLTMVVITLAD